MRSFQAKVGWKRMGKIENKKLSFRSVLTRCVIENYKKKSKKIQKYHYGFIRSQNRLKKRMRKRETKNFRSVPFPTRNRNFQKNSKKIPKFKKYLYGFIWRRMRKRENKDYHSVPTRLLIENSKNIQKIKKIPL